MNFSLKNTPSIYLYLISIVCFVMANLVRDKYDFAYGFLLVFGLGLFGLGFVNRNKNK